MTKDMTTGRVAPLLINFTIPLVLGNMFQLMYNAVDSIIVGKFVGEEALAAVGTCNPLVTLAILFISGLCIGAGILMGMHYGAKDYELLERQISSTMIGGLIFALLFAVICITAAPGLLRLIQTQEELMGMAVIYLRIVLCGLVFTFIYNFYANVLRAMGDSQSPLFFLIISSLLNIIGDLFFVIVLKWGSAGCALATVISEGMSCLCCGIYIKKKVPLLCLGKKWMIFDRELFVKTVQYGWASAMQQGTVQVGKICVQTIVNTMGIPAMATFAVVNRIDDFAVIPGTNIGHAMTSFLAQNSGAHKTGRLKEGFFCGMKIELIYGAIGCTACLLFARPFMELFVRDEEIIGLGVKYLHLMAPMYFLPAVTNGIQGYFRGIGDLKVTLVSSFINVGVRVIAAAVLVFLLSLNITYLPIAYAVGWGMMFLAEFPLLLRQLRKLRVS